MVPETLATGLLAGCLGSELSSLVLVTCVGISAWITSFLNGLSNDVGVYVLGGRSAAIILVLMSGLGIGDEIRLNPSVCSAPGTDHWGPTTPCC